MAEIKKQRRIERKKSAVRHVEVRLFGWPAERRMLSNVEEYWAVEFRFQNPDGSGPIMTKTVFETQDYEEAYVKYLAYVEIVK